MAALILLTEEEYNFCILCCNYFIFINIINIKYFYSLNTLTLNWNVVTLVKLKDFPSDALFMQGSDSDKVFQWHCHASTVSSPLAVLPDSFLPS